MTVTWFLIKCITRIYNKAYAMTFFSSYDVALSSKLAFIIPPSSSWKDATPCDMRLALPLLGIS